MYYSKSVALTNCGTVSTTFCPITNNRCWLHIIGLGFRQNLHSAEHWKSIVRFVFYHWIQQPVVFCKKFVSLQARWVQSSFLRLPPLLFFRRNNESLPGGCFVSRSTKIVAATIVNVLPHQFRRCILFYASYTLSYWFYPIPLNSASCELSAAGMATAFPSFPILYRNCCIVSRKRFTSAWCERVIRKKGMISSCHWPRRNNHSSGSLTEIIFIVNRQAIFSNWSYHPIFFSNEINSSCPRIYKGK